MGIISPVGSRLDDAWQSVCEGISGISLIDHFDTSNFPTRIAGLVKDFEVDDYLSRKDQRKNDPFIHYGVAAAMNAITDAGLEITEDNGHTIGIAMGSGIGGIKHIEDNHNKMIEGGARKVSPFFIPGSIINMTSGQVSILQHITGPNISIVTACATSTHCMGLAARSIEHGDAEIMLAGGSEYATTPLAMGGFCSAKAMSTRNDDPTHASRPFDLGRDGFVLSNGAGCVVLEELEHAKNRGAQIYAELIGFGMSGDAYHITLPPADGEGARKCMTAALRDAGIDPSEKKPGGQLHQIDHGSPSRCRWGSRSDLLRAGHQEPGDSSDDQPGKSGSGLRPGLCAERSARCESSHNNLQFFWFRWHQRQPGYTSI
jgi:3-oxoacyl-[acyl-carrier-protein] synthase II